MRRSDFGAPDGQYERKGRRKQVQGREKSWEARLRCRVSCEWVSPWEIPRAWANERGIEGLSTEIDHPKSLSKGSWTWVYSYAGKLHSRKKEMSLSFVM